ncbi:hypothetical protein Tco_1159804 [Tanacetum coccineum]
MIQKERELLDSIIEQIKIEIDGSKQNNKALESSNKALREENTFLNNELTRYKDSDFVENAILKCATAYGVLEEQKVKSEKSSNAYTKKILSLNKKISEMENKLASVQMMNMLNQNCKTSFVKPQYLKKAQSENSRMYDVGCYNDNLALMLAPESDETIISSDMKIAIQQKLNPTANRLTNDVDEFYQTLKEEMVADLKYFKSLENEVESLQSQLELQQT